MKILYLVRHAKSYWGDQSIPDFDRQLNKRGKRDAPFMGDVLKDKKVKPELIICSPAKRTKKTAIEIAAKINFPKLKIQFNDDLYEASANTIIKILKRLEENTNSVMIFGHNPGLTLLNNQISDKYIDNIPTCGIVALKLDVNWDEINKNSCEQIFFEFPKLYKK